ncbi:M1 family metallopeptidase [Actinoplanes siamensis]|nr:M1 family metallopeptidase [Actinoplanes siamensis]
MKQRGSIPAAMALLLLAAGCTKDNASPPPSVAAPAFRPGTDGIGDPYFPKYGNGGYDVAGYNLDLRYDPKAGKLAGRATITATATQDLSRFDFDLARLQVSGVTVDGVAASSLASDNKLVVTPATGIASGQRFTVVVNYAGVPGLLENKALGNGGWIRTKDGGGIALGQPESASTWYPVNDHPADKATFALSMTVPSGLEVISNGVPGPRATAGGSTTWRWSESSPMASYLSFVVIGQYRVGTGTHDGEPMITAVPDSLPATGPAARSLAMTGEITDYLASVFGPYPFDANGGVVVADDRIEYALETQSRPVYGPSFFTRKPNPGVIAHEIAHQWFGDSVSLDRWQDIWLNEGFATYAEWLWSEHSGVETAQQHFDDSYARFDWRTPPGNPGPAQLFGDAVYERGGMTVHALRTTIGDNAFFRLLRTWTSEHRNGNGTTAEFIATAEKVSGMDLDGFFQSWLYGTVKPTAP